MVFRRFFFLRRFDALTRWAVFAFVRVLSAFAIALLLVALAVLTPLRAAPWADIPSDLPQDPALREGTLPNGLRYVLLPNAHPANQVSLRLLVSAGSLHERDDERGLAHFVEHMAFRGTRSRPHGSLIAALERMGIAFGPDTAAFTGHDYTIYHLELPDASEKSLRDGLRVFRDYASSIEFAPDDIERERGVILSEMATRDTGRERAANAQHAFIWPEARHHARSPIGLEAQVKTFTREKFTAFHDAWYRPERLAVIAVGAIEPAALARIIGTEFADLAARAPARPEPPEPAPLSRPAPALGIFSDPGLTGINFLFTRSWREPRASHLRADRIAQLHTSLANYIVLQRLTTIARRPGAVIGSSSVVVNEPIRDVRAAVYEVPGNLGNWRYALREAEQELRRALAFGFAHSELAEAKTAFASNIAQAVATASSRRSEHLASQLAQYLLRGGGFATPQASWDELKEPLAAAAVDDCLAAFRAAWSDAPPRLFVSLHDSMKLSPAEIEETLAASRRAPVSAPVEAAPVAFAYADPATPGRVEKTARVHALDVSLLRFANGTRLNFKPTAFEKNRFLLNVRVGLGRLSQPTDQPGLAWVASQALIPGGVGKHVGDEIAQILAQRALAFHFTVDDDAFNFHLAGSPADLRLALRLVAAYIADPAFRLEGLSQARSGIANAYVQASSSPGASLSAVLERVLTDDRRFGWYDRDEPFARNLTELRDWLAPQFAVGDIEASIVGDVAEEAALADFAATLGALPKRPPAPRAADRRAIAFVPSGTDAQNTLRVPVPDELKLGAVACVWTVPTPARIHDERASRLLAAVLSTRARHRLRDEMGASYQVSAAFVIHHGFPSFNYFLVQAEVDRDRVAQALDVLRKDVAALAADGISEDDFLRAKQPFANENRQAMLTNGYWSYTVLRDAQTNPARLAAAADRIEDVDSLTRAEIQALARRHLTPANVYRLHTFPAAAPAPSPRKPR